MWALTFLNYLFFICLWLIGPLFGPLSLVSLFFGIYWPSVVLVIYLVYRSIFKRRPWPALYENVARFNTSSPYFKSQKVLFDAPDDEQDYPEPDTKSLLLSHPHGMVCVGWTHCCGWNEKFIKSKISSLGAEALFSLPFIADYFTWMFVRPASKNVLLKAMEKGENLALVPGGFEEATIFEYGKHRLFMKKRAGFIKYALQHGYRLFPVYHFGEEKTYYSFPYFLSFRLWLNKYKIPAVLFTSAGGYFLLPNPNLIFTTVVGKPLQLPTIPNPTNEQVSHYHELYIKCVVDLFNKYKGKYTDEGEAANLEIW